MSIESRKLNRFIDLFQKWNKSINLSAATKREELEEHLEDSRHVVEFLDQGRTARSLPDGGQLSQPGVAPDGAALDSAPAMRVLDVGSGGGFPVVIAAICLPEVSFTSLEPVHKKHAFLRTAARELGIPNLEPLAMRLEDHDVRDYDAAMSRATFDLVEWLALGTQYVREGGIVLAFEAVPRDDLPTGANRHPYSLVGKQRAIIELRR